MCIRDRHTCGDLIGKANLQPITPLIYLLDNGCIDLDNDDHLGTATNDLKLSKTSTQSSKPEPFHNPDYDFSGCTIPQY